MAEKHIFISLGSNLGNRLDNLTKALISLEAEDIRVLVISSIYETLPWGFESNSFLLFFRSFENALESRGLSFFLLDLTPNELLSISRFLLFALVLKALFKSDVAFFFLLFVCLNGLLGSSLFELLRSIEKESERYLVPPSEPHWLNSRIKEMDDSI